MGRQYSEVSLRHQKQTIHGLTALFDSGADISVIGSEIATRLGLEQPTIEIEWHSSDGNDEYSPVVELEVKTPEDPDFIVLPGVLIDDRPIDLEAGEHMVLGLDYLQQAKRVLRF